MKKEPERQLPHAKPLSLYPLKFQEVIADVLKVKPEPKTAKAKAHSRRAAKRKRKG